MEKVNVFLSKLKPIISRLGKNSGKIFRKLKGVNINRKKLKKLISALEESKSTRGLLNFILVSCLVFFVVKKSAEYYDEKDSFKGNAKKIFAMIKKIMKKMRNYECQ